MCQDRLPRTMRVFMLSVCAAYVSHCGKMVDDGWTICIMFTEAMTVCFFLSDSETLFVCKYMYIDLQIRPQSLLSSESNISLSSGSVRSLALGLEIPLVPPKDFGDFGLLRCDLCFARPHYLSLQHLSLLVARPCLSLQHCWL